MFKPFGVTTSGKAEKRQRQTSSESEKFLRKEQVCLPMAVCEQLIHTLITRGSRTALPNTMVFDSFLHKAITCYIPLSTTLKWLSFDLYSMLI